MSTVRAALQTMDGNNQQEGDKEDSLKAEQAKNREQVAELKKRNEEMARKVSLYEDPLLEDAMHERIQMSLDRKEKLLQAELKDKIGMLAIL